jgi:alpha-L-fucosidase
MTAEPRDIPATPVVPTERQIEYQQMELLGFVHFTVNTFTDLEWGDGTESPSIFTPTQLDTFQWTRAAKEAGLGQLIITAKHHDGFCLWPSQYTEHSVKSSPWKDGTGDVVGDLSAACRAAELRFGIYLSPWDRHEPCYGTDRYNRYYLDQLAELLTSYGEISEIWMDGAKGEEAKDMEYDFDAFRAFIRKHQPDALIFSDAGPDLRWIGNEKGIAGETCWSTINGDDITIGAADTAYLNAGDPQGNRWLVPECDVSTRPGWFYHAAEDDRVKTPQELVDLYYKSVGRNGTLLLNIPPDRRGLFHENDVASLREFRSIIDETFAEDRARGKSADADSQFLNHDKFSASNLLDGDPDTYWAAAEGATQATVEIDLGTTISFDRVMLQEPIRFGQRVSSFSVEAKQDGGWKRITTATTIGHKRLLRVDSTQANAIRVTINATEAPVALSNIGLYQASPREA